MDSAFGINHGVGISKGFGGKLGKLPQLGNRAKAADKIATTPKNPRSLLATQGNTFTMSRDTARMYGQSAARSMKSNPNQAAVHRMMGQDAKRTSRRTLQEASANRSLSPKRFLP